MPATNTVRLHRSAYKALKAIAQMTGEPLPDVLDRAIQDLHRKVYLEGLCADYRALRRDAVAREDFARETAAWDVTCKDGLEDA